MSGQRSLLALGLSVVLGSCGSPPTSGGDGGTDGGGGGNVTVVAVNPADGATKVSILVGVVVATLSGSADPASIDDSTVALYEGESKRRIPGTVAYDDPTHEITVSLAGPLFYASTYRLVISGVKAKSGTAVPDFTSRFSTYVDPTSTWTSYTGSGTPTTTMIYTVDADGNYTRRVYYNGPGNDGIWGTPDDAIAYWDDIVTNGGSVRYIDHTGPGPDGVYFTSDDPIAKWTVYDSGPKGPTDDVSYTDPGPDGVWLNSDDTPGPFYQFTYDSQDRLDRFLALGVGPDGKALTSDDTVAAYYQMVRNQPGHLKRAYYANAGPDGVWFTGDDVATSWENNVVDVTGRSIDYVRSTDPGPDGVWLTPDDGYVAHWKSDINASSGLPTRLSTYAAGPDGKLLTADDVVSGYYEFTYDSQGNLKSYDGYSPGADGKAFTADDVEIYHEGHLTDR